MKKLLVLLLLFSIATVFAQQPKKDNSIYESLQLNIPKKKTTIEELKIKKKVVKKIKVSYLEPTNTEQTIWYETFRDGKTMEQVAESLEKIFKIKTNMKITCMQCDAVNAYYNSETKELTICYDLFVDMYNKMSKYHSDPDSLGEKIGKAFSFVLYHEVGHAMIDVLDLPLTGKEEDAADYFAFFMLGSNEDDYGVDVCREGALFFKDMHDNLRTDTTFQRLNEEGKIYDALPYWDEHSFDLQRYYSINSLIFGSNPDKWYGNIDIGYRRPYNAIQEFNKINRGWARVLLPHIKVEQVPKKGKK